MKKTLRELREAHNDYLNAYQARYDELVGDWSGNRESEACFDAHKRATERITAELSAVEFDAPTSATAYIDLKGNIYDSHRVKIYES